MIISKPKAAIAIRALFSIIFFSLSFVAVAQIKTEQLSQSALPKTITYQGKFVQALRYQDKSGTHLTIITQTGTQPQKGEDDSRQAHLYAYAYTLQGTAATPLWQLHDMVINCEADVVANFIPGTFAVTDLDKNGQAEVWVAYRTACRGDVSPSELKIIMHEGSTKYALRGIGKIKAGGSTAHDGGQFTMDDAFKKAPAEFRQYAGKLWDKNVTEIME